MADWGKLLVWAFIAGFAERFVPGVLDRLSGNSDVAAGTPLIANTTNSAVLIPGSAVAADAQNAATPPATPPTTPPAPDAPPAAQPATTST
jgi:hypothetical protein